MIDRNSPVTEDELHAYIDGELPADRKETVATWLATHPEQAALVAAWRAQAESMRARYGPIVDEPIPERLKLDQVIRSERAQRAFVGRYGRGRGHSGFRRRWRSRLDGARSLRRRPDRLRIHRRRGARRLQALRGRGAPSGRSARQRAHHMTQWLSKRLGEELRIPDLQSIGLKLVGGRLLPGRPARQRFICMKARPANVSRSTAPSRACRKRPCATRVRQLCRVLLGRRQDCLRREWTGRPRAAGEHTQGDLRTDRQDAARKKS